MGQFGRRRRSYECFLTFQVEIDFAIPFLTIPVKDSVDGVMGSIMKVVTKCSRSGKAYSDANSHRQSVTYSRTHYGFL